MEVFSYTKCIVIVLDDTYGIDKIYTKKNDIFDAFRLVLKFYSFRDSIEYD
jgi:hypothetical protein